MSIEMEPQEVAERLRHEFELVAMAPGLVTAEVVAAGRRRRRNRLLTAGVASVAVLTALAVGVPAALHARADRPAVTTADAGSTIWKRCPSPDDGPKASLPPELAERLQEPEPSEWWTSTITIDRLHRTIETKLREVSPGTTLDRVHDMGGDCNPIGQGALVAFNLVRADGVKGALQVSLSRDPGDPADRAEEVVRTGRRETNSGERYAIPPEVPADKPREQRTLGAGVYAVLYPEGVNGWEIPVDLFAPDDMTVVVQGERYRGPTGPAGVQIPRMNPSESPLSFDQLLEIGAAVAALR
jgi:hypothetical protein